MLPGPHGTPSLMIGDYGWAVPRLGLFGVGRVNHSLHCMGDAYLQWSVLRKGFLRVKAVYGFSLPVNGHAINHDHLTELTGCSLSLNWNILSQTRMYLLFQLTSYQSHDNLTQILRNRPTKQSGSSLQLASSSYLVEVQLPCPAFSYPSLSGTLMQAPTS
jgi:hypothetical protein